jgi:hypothetical protein
MRLLIAHDAANRFNETLNVLRWAGLPRDATAKEVKIESENELVQTIFIAIVGIFANRHACVGI